MLPYTALVTLLAVGLYYYFATRVAVARRRFGVALPATFGNANEWMPIFLAPFDSLSKQLPARAPP